MNKCPWCGRNNLNVYAYCQGCGRGFSGPERQPVPASPRTQRWYWPFGRRAA